MSKSTVYRNSELLCYSLNINKQPKIRLKERRCPVWMKCNSYQPFYTVPVIAACCFICPFQGTSLTTIITALFRAKQLHWYVIFGADDSLPLDTARGRCRRPRRSTCRSPARRSPGHLPIQKNQMQPKSTSSALGQQPINHPGRRQAYLSDPIRLILV